MKPVFHFTEEEKEGMRELRVDHMAKSLGIKITRRGQKEQGKEQK